MSYRVLGEYDGMVNVCEARRVGKEKGQRRGKERGEERRGRKERVRKVRKEADGIKGKRKKGG